MLSIFQVAPTDGIEVELIFHRWAWGFFRFLRKHFFFFKVIKVLLKVKKRFTLQTMQQKVRIADLCAFAQIGSIWLLTRLLSGSLLHPAYIFLPCPLSQHLNFIPLFLALPS